MANRFRSLDALSEDVSNACYAEILPHIEQYHQIEDVEDALPLMEPHYFRAFLRRGVDEATQIAVQELELRFNAMVPRRVRGDTQLADFAPGNATSPVRRALLGLIGEFESRLEAFGRELEGFRGVVQGSGERAHTQAFGAGAIVGALGGAALGPLGILAGAAAGYFAGKQVDDELAAHWKRLEQSFFAVLEMYDAAVDAICEGVASGIDEYQMALDQAVREIASPTTSPPLLLDGSSTGSRRGGVGLVVAGVVLLCAVVGGAWFALQSTSLDETKAALEPVRTFVLPSNSTIRSGPGADFEVVGTMSSDEAAMVLDETSSGWRQVRAGGLTGWVRMEEQQE